MADVAVPTQARIEAILDDLLDRWRDVPRVAREIATWDPAEQLDYTEEWPLHDDKLSRLRAAATGGQLSPHQRRRYEDLERLVERHDPTLRALLR